MQTLLSGIERKVTYEKAVCINQVKSLSGNCILHCHFMYFTIAKPSWEYVNKRASQGIDKVSAKTFERNMTKEVKALESDLKCGSYKANLIRQTHIQKPNGGQRPLGIPTVRDKLLQTTCSKILEAIYEPKFHDFRYGYRKCKVIKIQQIQ